ncbi:MAG: IS701-like element ISGur14 family transposase, partial [Thermoplasmata archaeon]
MSNKIDYTVFEEYMKPFEQYFYRSEGKELARSYVTGLMIEGERKSVEPMSERVH